MTRKLKDEHTHGSVPCEVDDVLVGAVGKPEIKMDAGQAALLAVAIQNAITDVQRGDMRTTEAREWKIALVIFPDPNNAGRASIGVFAG